MEIVTSTNRSTNVPKRTRLNVRQSKDGCLTCRARKIKCDETKPSCLRCERSSKQCEGYRLRTGSRFLSHNGTTDQGKANHLDCLTGSSCPASSLYHRLSHRRCISSQEAAYSRLGLEVLLQQRYEKVRWSQQPAWIHLLAQLLPFNEAVHTSIVSLGAAYEVRGLLAASIRPQCALARTQKAIAALQKEICDLAQGPVPVFLASVVLGATEVLQRHLLNAVVHLGGAFKALGYMQTCSADSAPFSAQSAPSEGISGGYGELYALAQSLDLQAAWYALSEPPKLPESSQFTVDLLSTDSEAGNNAGVLPALHGCYHFAHRAAEFKYRPRACVPPSVSFRQSRYVAALTDWLARSSQPIRGPKGSWSKESLVQRVQGLSTLIYLSTILSPYEATYDFYLAQFQEIVEISEHVLAVSDDPHPAWSMPRFQLQPGVFQAVFLTAMKCRDRRLRRQALDLFSSIGVEGPWDARIMATVAQRAIEVEEMGQPLADQDSCGRLPIPETQRLHGCGADSSAASEHAFRNCIQVHFSLCRNVESMLQSSNHNGADNWLIWTEQLEIREVPALSMSMKHPRDSIVSWR